MQPRKKTAEIRMDNMWGFPLEVWEKVFLWVTGAALVFGGLGVTAAFFSALLGYKISDAVQWNAEIKIEEVKLESAQNNAKSNEKIAALNMESEKSREGIAQANAEVAKANENVETLRAKNLEFEKAVSPRILEQNLTAQKLKQYSGISVLVVSPSDFEPKRTAGQIRFMLAQAGWKRLTGLLKTDSPFFDGVVVHAALSSEHVINAADALVSVLNENGIEARRGYPVMELGPSAVLVEVGPKPLPPSLRLKPESVKADEHGNKVWGNIME